ncbi:MAG: hypothetical protein ACJAUH_003065 [Saprospiraceae bacterium]|jgi:hypothetical protein
MILLTNYPVFEKSQLTFSQQLETINRLLKRTPFSFYFLENNLPNLALPAFFFAL